LRPVVGRGFGWFYKMCGIVGFVNNSGTAADRAVIEAMNAAIIHRGPDDEGYLDAGSQILMTNTFVTGTVIDVDGGVHVS